MEEIPITVPGITTYTYTRTHMINDRGTTVTPDTVGRDLDEYFIYQDNDIKFQFVALRFDGTERRTISDTYQVFIPKHYRNPGFGTPVETIKRIKCDVDEVLRIYPSRFPPSIKTPLPKIEKVVFYLSEDN